MTTPSLPGCPRCDDGRAEPSGNCLPRCVAAMAMLQARRAAARALVMGPGTAAVFLDPRESTIPCARCGAAIDVTSCAPALRKYLASHGELCASCCAEGEIPRGI